MAVAVGCEPFPKQTPWLFGMRAHVLQEGGGTLRKPSYAYPTSQPNPQRVLFLSLELGFSAASRSLSLS